MIITDAQLSVNHSYMHSSLMFRWPCLAHDDYSTISLTALGTHSITLKTLKYDGVGVNGIFKKKFCFFWKMVGILFLIFCCSWKKQWKYFLSFSRKKQRIFYSAVHTCKRREKTEKKGCRYVHMHKEIHKVVKFVGWFAYNYTCFILISLLA